MIVVEWTPLAPAQGGTAQPPRSNCPVRPSAHPQLHPSHPPRPALHSPTHPCLATRPPPVRGHNAHGPGRGLHPAGGLPTSPLHLPGPHRQAAQLCASWPHCPGSEDGHQCWCAGTQEWGWGEGYRRYPGGDPAYPSPPQTSPSRSAGSAATWPSWWVLASPLCSKAAASSQQPSCHSWVSLAPGQAWREGTRSQKWGSEPHADLWLL